MFMFRSKRTALAKRLWKARIRKEHEAGSEAKNDTNENRDPRDFANTLNTDERSLRTEFLKRLNVNDLEMLAIAVETGETAGSSCVLLPRSLVEEPHLKCCQTWRWPDLRTPGELKQLPMCQSSKDPKSVCCNPFHWSRICKPESPPPPYQRFARERLKPEDRAPSEGGGGGGFGGDRREQLELRGSLTTEDEPCGMEWCRLAYWELSRRVGRQFAVFTGSINIFWTLPHPQDSGLCLETLAGHNFSPPEAVRRARDKIGRGLTLSLEPDGVWAYNRSDLPIFVNSPCLDDPDSRSHLVYRVPAGHCLNVFVPGAAPRDWPPAPSPTGPVDRDSVRISFAKGWGPKYSRQEVTACPTWLEVLLAPCR